MNVVFLIGNGFDRNLELNTSYGEFYRYYEKQDSGGDKTIEALKKSIKSGIENWSDLEVQLGKYTSNLESVEEFDQIYFDLAEKLSVYLQAEQDKIDPNKFDSNVLFKDLINPERALTQVEKTELNKKTTIAGNGPVNISILTFNYTQTIQKIIGDKNTNLSIGKKGNKNVVLRGVEHIHRFIGETLVLGVDNIDQIDNIELRKSQEVVEALVKPIHNQEQGHARDLACKQAILSANLIYIFGSSIGETDKTWWSVVGERLGSNSCCLVIMTRGSPSSQRHLIYRSREKRKIKESFLSLTGLSEEEKNIAEKSIYVGITRDIFNLRKST